MHHALEITEILLNIFNHCHPDRYRGWIELASLARTCRTFKEPALDVLWEELHNISTLARCIPGGYYACRDSEGTWHYSFHRSLTDFEWVILRSYTRRVRSIFLEDDDIFKLDQKALDSLLKLATMESLFPNVRRLRLSKYTYEVMPLFSPLPSLRSLEVQAYESHLLGNCLDSLAKTSPSLTRLLIYSYNHTGINTRNVKSSFLCQWQNLRNVQCSEMHLDITSLMHLSRMPALTQLSFKLLSTLPEQMSPSDAPLLFSNLQDLMLFSTSLDLVSRFLSRTQLPVIIIFTVSINDRPSKRDISSFLASIWTSGIGRTIQKLWLDQNYVNRRWYAPPGDMPAVCLEDLEPCTAFIHLRRIKLNVECSMNLTDSDLFVLTSSWPRLEHLLVNEDWGWHARGGGITPVGLLQLLRRRPLLTRIALAIDTRGYTGIPASHSLVSLGLTLAPKSRIDVVDSYLDADAVPAVAAFFAGILPRADVSFTTWSNWKRCRDPSRAVCEARWVEVCDRIEDAVSSRSGARHVCRPPRGTTLYL